MFLVDECRGGPSVFPYDGGMLCLQFPMPREANGMTAHEEDMIRLFHDQACGTNRMKSVFNVGHRASLQSAPIHNSGIHPFDTVQLTSRAKASIKFT